MEQHDFIALGYSAHDSIMLADAHQAITKAGLWKYFALPTTPGKDGFMFSTDNELVVLGKCMKYDGHSGASYGWTMRIMELIAKNGMESIRTKPVVTIPPIPSTFEEMKPERKSSFSGLWKDFMHELKHSPNENLREQGAILRKFEKGEISYAEMRQHCG